ncbi:hypothetical protein [Cyclobacterium xiamenense]|uniref:hypothetical protein n=1 Tax=Cyclobacterium xiamenense TaxID=1297121 RepID=UPI0035CFCFEC
MTEQVAYTPSFFYVYLWLFCLLATCVLLSTILYLVREIARNDPPEGIAPEIREGWLRHQIRRRTK